jgi:hypothetical protein
MTAREPKLRTTPEGDEKLCAKCRDWWPADLEFFYSDPSGAGGLFLYCKACYMDHVRRPAARSVSRANKEAVPAERLALADLAAAFNVSQRKTSHANQA